MHHLTFHVTDGPAYKPNGYYKAKVVRRSDQSGFFVMENERGETSIVHEANLKLLWHDQKPT